MSMRLINPIVAGLMVSLALGASGCTHTDPASVVTPPPEGPFTNASPAQLTFNSGRDELPSFTQDGLGILYSFQVSNRTDRDRCVGLLPAEGGSRRFTLCESRRGFNDSTDNLAASALSSAGALLYVASTSRTNAQLPGTTRLTLSDTSEGASTRTLITMPVRAGSLLVDWLVDIRWIGPANFVALGQQFTVMPRCPGCAQRDTIFIPIAVVRGEITALGATLTPVLGTEGAVAYGLAAPGNDIVFRTNQVALQRVALEGGLPVVAIGVPPPETSLPPGATRMIVDHDCQGGKCAVLTITQIPSLSGPYFEREIYTLPASGGAASRFGFTSSLTSPRVWEAVRLSPDGSRAVVVTRAVNQVDLFLFTGLP